MKIVKGPDFPSAAFYDPTNLEAIYETGEGILKSCGKVDFNEKREYYSNSIATRQSNC